MKTSDEEWRDIPGFTGQYQVSSRGRVRSVLRSVSIVKFDGSQQHRKAGKMLTPQHGQYVSLYDDKHHRHTYTVDQLYTMAFTPAIFANKT